MERARVIMQMLIMSRLRWTRQRKLILDALKGRTDHPTAEQIYHELRERGETVSLATVYRTLRALVREGLLRELHGDGPDRFDPFVEPHYHFRCIRCGRVYDVATPYRGELDRVEVGPGFVITSHQITWEGICPECSREGKERRKHGEGSAGDGGTGRG